MTKMTKSYDYSPNIKGTISTLVNGVKLSTIKTNGKTFTFNVFTIISGCKFKHLAIGDKVLIRKARTKGEYCIEIQIVDIEKKWNHILQGDTKYSIDHNLEIGENVIRPEIISPAISIFSINAIKEVINLNPKISERDRKILELHLDGKSGSVIAKLIKNISTRQVDRIIKRYRELVK